MPAIYELCRDGKLDEVRAALARGGDVNDKDSNGKTALMWAVIFFVYLYFLWYCSQTRALKNTTLSR